MSNITVVSRKNKETGQMEDHLMTMGTIIAIESTSKLTVNKKPYGFFTADICGAVSTGIAYDAVVKGRKLVPGEQVQVEILKQDALNKFNNRWKISLATAEALSTSIETFLATLK